MALSLALYVAAARAPWLNLPLVSASGDHWLFDPFSWQLLFVMGMALGSRDTFARFNLPRKRTLLWIIGFALGTIAVWKSLAVVGKIYQIPDLAVLSLLSDVPGMDLRTVGITRLLYFISLLVLLIGIMPSTEYLRQLKLAKPVIACGQKSLEIFCLSTLLSELGALVLFEINGNYLSYLVVITIGLFVMFVTALFLTSFRFHNAVFAFSSSAAAYTPSLTLIDWIVRSARARPLFGSRVFTACSSLQRPAVSRMIAPHRGQKAVDATRP